MDRFNIPSHIKVPKQKARKNIGNAKWLLSNIETHRVGCDKADEKVAMLHHECFEYLISAGYFKEQMEGV